MSSQVLSAQASAELTVWVELLRGHSGLTRQLNAQLLQQHGLTINDFEVLVLLNGAEEQAMRRVDIAEAVVLSPSGVTRLLKGLESSGWVEKRACATDARVTYASLTESGQAKLDEASDSHIETIRGALAERYSAAELEKLRELLSRLPGAESLVCQAAGAGASDDDGSAD
jgi:DNA-binding MarR family transcriptional regulator